jgi:hypothetical protein
MFEFNAALQIVQCGDTLLKTRMPFRYLLVPMLSSRLSSNRGTTCSITTVDPATTASLRDGNTSCYSSSMSNLTSADGTPVTLADAVKESVGVPASQDSVSDSVTIMLPHFQLMHGAPPSCGSEWLTCIWMRILECQKN